MRVQEEQVATKTREVDAYRNVTVRQGLSGRVLAYNPGWNFVVLSIGDKAGLKSGVQMIVTRGNQAIGKVRVTSVEPNTAIADVLPGTMARGQSVQAGTRSFSKARAEPRRTGNDGSSFCAAAVRRASLSRSRVVRPIARKIPTRSAPIPWNRPERWESQGPLGGMMPRAVSRSWCGASREKITRGGFWRTGISDLSDFVAVLLWGANSVAR